MSGKELFEYYTEGKAGSIMNDLAFLLDMACQWDHERASSILDDCLDNGKKLKAIYQDSAEKIDIDDTYIGEIPSGKLYLTSA
jgi:hypothetical protein